MWYQRVMDASATDPKPESTVDPEVARPRKNKNIDDEDLRDNPADFRRVRLRYWDASHELGGSLIDQATDPIPRANAKTTMSKAAEAIAASFDRQSF